MEVVDINEALFLVEPPLEEVITSFYHLFCSVRRRACHQACLSQFGNDVDI